MPDFVPEQITSLLPVGMPLLTVLVLTSLVAVALVMLVGGGDATQRSMDDVYERRARRSE